ncbi:MAG: phosphotyrosine protein phosphatase [Rhodospirillaceae bacterium]|nr:phosphotyrosine protein phosphatase [Rhodospirillaceae bacterium]
MTVGVLFVCTGNICRSPTAESVFRSLVHDAGLKKEISIESAGIHSYHVGEPPDTRAIQTALSRGYKMVGLSSRRVFERDFHLFDLIIAMDKSHLRHLKAMAPGDTYERVKLFLSFATGMQTSEVPDPYYNNSESFEEVLNLIEKGSIALLKEIQSEYL